MKYLLAAAAFTLALAAIACNNTGLSSAPRATFSQLACLDTNGDDRINADDAADMSELPDFNADGERDLNDATFLAGLDIPLDPGRDRTVCGDRANKAPEYLVAHGYFAPAEVTCSAGEAPVAVIGVGGGVVNLREKEDAAGIRGVVDAILERYEDEDIDTIGVLAGPAIVGAENVHFAMEDWITHAAEVYLERYPCIRLVLIGHSHGAITVDVAGARIEEEYADRIIAIVDLDRVEELYIGNLTARPVIADVFNVYETTDGRLRGAPYDSPNVENWDASAEEHDGEPVTHTTIDTAATVRARVVEEVMERS
jgi:hypothetical protein